MDSLPAIKQQHRYPAWPLGLGIASLVAVVALGILGGAPILNHTLNPQRFAVLGGSALFAITTVVLFIIAYKKKEKIDPYEKEISELMSDKKIDLSNPAKEMLKKWHLTRWQQACQMDSNFLAKVILFRTQNDERVLDFKKLSEILNFPNSDPSLMNLIVHLYTKTFIEKIPKYQKDETLKSLIQFESYGLFKSMSPEKIEVLLTTFADTLFNLKPCSQNPYNLFIANVVISTLKPEQKIAFLEKEIKKERLNSDPLEFEWYFREDEYKSDYRVLNPSVMHLCAKDPTLLKWVLKSALKSDERVYIQTKVFDNFAENYFWNLFGKYELVLFCETFLPECKESLSLLKNIK